LNKNLTPLFFKINLFFEGKNMNIGVIVVKIKEKYDLTNGKGEKKKE